MEKGDKGSTLTMMGVSGWMFLLVPAYPGCPGSKAVKRSLLLLLFILCIMYASTYGWIKMDITTCCEIGQKPFTVEIYRKRNSSCLVLRAELGVMLRWVDRRHLLWSWAKLEVRWTPAWWRRLVPRTRPSSNRSTKVQRCVLTPNHCVHFRTFYLSYLFRL